MGSPDRYDHLFTPGTADALGHYVYALRDPRDGEIFYVGKGVGERVLAHVRGQALSGEGEDLETKRRKEALIRAIHKAGLPVEHLLLRTHLASDTEAFVVEQAVIDAFAADASSSGTLTNLVKGRHSELYGLATLADASARFGAEQAPPLPEGSLVVIINRLWEPGKGDAEIKEATRKSWVMAEWKTKKVRHAFAVARDVIRGAYDVDPDSWIRHRRKGKPDRWEFNGSPMLDADRYVGRELRAVMRVGTHASANPVRYFLNGT